MAVRNWSDGETLTAAAMNELVSSTTMRFASAAARDAVLVGDLAPVDGMTAFLLDSNLTFKYIVVNGTGYWAPQAGTVCFFAYQKTSQNLVSNTYNFIAPIDGLANNRNLNNWYNPTTATFTPLCPGYYQMFGGVGVVATTAANVYRVGLTNNSNTFVQASARDYMHASYTGFVGIAFRRHIAYMNGTTDFLRLAIYPPASDITAIGLGNSINSGFGAVYLGM